MHVTIPYSSGTVETVVTIDGEFDLPVPVYPSSGEITNPGEIAISTLDGYEAICIKSDQNENVLFSDDATNQTKLSSWYNSANGGLSLAQNNDNGPVLSLSEGVPLSNQPILEDHKSGNTATLFVTGYGMEGYSLTPLKDSESCVVYGYQDDLPYNLSVMDDIKINVLINKSTTLELTIDNGTDIRKLQSATHKGFLCDSIHGLENVQPKQIHTGSSFTGETVPGYELKYTVSGDITASFADSSQTGCYAVASHAEGSHSTTFAVGSHAEGHNTSVDGKFSHSEGYQSNASGLYSSAHNNLTSTNPSATGSSVYGFHNSVVNLGEFACGEEKEYNGNDGRLFSVGDGICIDQGDTTPNTPMFQLPQCTPHSVFKILSGGTSGNAYYYPLFDLSSTSAIVTRNLVITATVGGDKQTKTLDEWYTYLTNGGN